MNNTPKNSRKLNNLRKRAEDFLQKNPHTIKKMPEKDIKSLIEELQIYQAELEMQREELQRSQVDLEEVRDRYVDLYDFAPIGYFSMNQKGVIHEANLTFASMLSVDRSALIGQPFTRFVLSDDQDIFYKHRQALLETGAPQSFELRLVKKDGYGFFVRLECATDTNKDEKQIRVAVSDITERKQAEDALHKAHHELERVVEERTAELAKTNHELVEEIIERKKIEKALRESEGRYRSLTDDVLDSSAVGIFILDSDFRVVWVNQALEDYFGLKRNEIIGKDKRQLIHERIKDIFKNPGIFTKKVITTYDDNTYIERFQCHVLPSEEREERWLEHRSQPIQSGLYAGGRIEHYYDITAQKQAEEAILKSAEKYRSLVEFTEDSIYLVDRDGTYLFVNEKHLSRLGSPVDKVIGRTYGEFHLIDDTKAFEEKIEEVFETGQTTQHEHRSLRDDRYFLRTLSPVKTPDGSTTSVTVVSKDITERKQSEEAMLRSEKLASLGQFSAGLAHELRNPLAVISSCSQFCLESRQPEDLVKENFQVIYRSSRKASHLINELLAFARPAHLEYSDVEINPLIIRMLQMAQLEVTHDRVNFVKRLGKGLPKVHGDEEKLGQVLVNLLQNAIYAVSHQGEITIETGLADPGEYLEVNITDDGPGIPHDYLCRIFDPFFTTRDGGTGLGLSICHAIMEQHQGSISVECGKEKGTRMTVRLPVQGGAKRGP